MPERLYSTMNLHNADFDCIVPSLEMELEEPSISHPVDIDIAKRVQRMQLVSNFCLLQYQYKVDIRIR